MAIGFRAASISVYGAASVTPAIPASQVTTDMMLLFAYGKPFGAGWSVATSGWTALGSAASGSTAAGVDTGSMKMQVWYKEALIDTEADPTVTEGSPVWNVVGASIAVFSKAVGETWETPTVVYGADEVSGTSVSATMSADNSVAAGDSLVAAIGTNSDAMGPFGTATTYTQTGATFGGLSNLVDDETVTGGDMAAQVTRRAVTAGASSAAAVITATGTASGGADRTEVGYVRLRVSTPATAIPFTAEPRIIRRSTRKSSRFPG